MSIVKVCQLGVSVTYPLHPGLRSLRKPRTTALQSISERIHTLHTYSTKLFISTAATTTNSFFIKACKIAYHCSAGINGVTEDF